MGMLEEHGEYHLFSPRRLYSRTSSGRYLRRRKKRRKKKNLKKKKKPQEEEEEEEEEEELDWEKIYEDCRSLCYRESTCTGAWGRPYTCIQKDRKCLEKCVDKFRD